MKRFILALAFAVLGVAAFADFADIATELQRKSLLLECNVAPRIGKMVKAHCVGFANVVGVTNRVYTGEAITFDPVVKLDGTTLTKSTHYTQTFTNNTNAGKASVKIASTGAGGYFGSIIKSFVITPYPLSASMVANITEQVYTGSPVTPMPSVMFNGALLSADTDYSVSWEDNVATNTHAKCIITGKGNFGGVAVKEFTIREE